MSLRDKIDDIFKNLCNDSLFNFPEEEKSAKTPVFVNPLTQSIIFADEDIDNRYRMDKMERRDEHYDSLMDIFNEFDISLKAHKWDGCKKAAISNVRFEKKDNPMDVFTLDSYKRTVWTVDEGDNLVCLVKSDNPLPDFNALKENELRLFVISPCSDTQVPADNYRFVHSDNGNDVILMVTDVRQWLEDKFMDMNVFLQIRIMTGCEDFSIESETFALLTDDCKPQIKPVDMYFLDESCGSRDDVRYVGFNPDRQDEISTNFEFKMQLENEWIRHSDLEMEVRYKDVDTGSCCLSNVCRVHKGHYKHHYYIKDEVNTIEFTHYGSYKVEVCFLDTPVAECTLVMGRPIEADTNEWVDLTSQADDNNSDGIQDISELIGLENLKKEVEKTLCYMKLMNARSKAGLPCAGKLMHMVMSGGPGTGKTTVARMMGRVFKQLGFLSRGHLVEANRESLTDNIIGGTEKKTKRMLDLARGGVLFIDEAYSLGTDSEDGRDFGQRVLDTLMPVLSEPDSDILVILAGYSKEMERLMRINPGLASRFPVRLQFPDYTPDELMQIASLFFRKNKYTLADGVQERMMDVFRQAVLLKDFGNGRFVRTFIQNGILPQMGQRLMDKIDHGEYGESLLSEIVPADVPDAEYVLTSMGLAASKNKIIGFSR